jgi:hypothetical protein
MDTLESIAAIGILVALCMWVFGVFDDFDEGDDL